MATHLLILANGAEAPVPLHAALVNFTAGLLPASVLFDLLARALKRDVLLPVAWWTLLAAAVVTPFTAAAGWWWWWAGGSSPSEHSDHWQMPIHQWLGTGLAVALAPVAVWRGRLYKKGERPGWAYAAVAAALLIAVVFQGELGGSMTFGRGLVLRPHEGPARHDAGTVD